MFSKNIATLQKHLFFFLLIYEIHVCLIHNWDNKNDRGTLALLLLLILIVFYTISYHLSPFGIIKRISCFSRFELFFETYAWYFPIFIMQNIKSNCLIIFLKFLWSSFSDGQFILSQVYFFVRDLIFLIYLGCFPNFS